MISPRTAETGVMHERIATPSMMTVHAPHCAEPAAEARPAQTEVVAQDV